MAAHIEALAMNAEPALLAPAASMSGPQWLTNARVLWRHRVLLLRVAIIALVVNFGLVFLIPKQYESTARIMPPERSGSDASMLAALAGRALGGDMLGSLAASMLGSRNSGALFTELLKSGSVTGHIIEHFQLMSVYHARYQEDAAKKLLRRTRIVMDKKSGVITITVTDGDPTRARDMAQAYLDQLSLLVNRTSNSSAHQERMFIEQRLHAVKRDLDRAQQGMSDFSSQNATIDIREQTHAMVDAAAKLQAELIVTQGELESLQQIYGNENVRVRAAQARLANLQREMRKIAGSSAALAPDNVSSTESADPVSYPPLRQLPRLAVPYANLYRNVRLQENIFDLLTQQYEAARIQEAKDIPVVSIIDAPGIPEKKSFPRRKLFTLIMTALVLGATAAWLIFREHWSALSEQDPRRIFVREVFAGLNPKQLWPPRFRRRTA